MRRRRSRRSRKTSKVVDKRWRTRPDIVVEAWEQGEVGDLGLRLGGVQCTGRDAAELARLHAQSLSDLGARRERETSHMCVCVRRPRTQGCGPELLHHTAQQVLGSVPARLRAVADHCECGTLR